MADAQIIEELQEEVSKNIDLSKDCSDEEIMELIEKCVLEKSRKVYLSISQKSEIINIIFNSRRRLDVL